jgi:hypothetical protein
VLAGFHELGRAQASPTTEQQIAVAWVAGHENDLSSTILKDAKISYEYLIQHDEQPILFRISYGPTFCQVIVRSSTLNVDSAMCNN